MHGQQDITIRNQLEKSGINDSAKQPRESEIHSPLQQLTQRSEDIQSIIQTNRANYNGQQQISIQAANSLPVPNNKKIMAKLFTAQPGNLIRKLPPGPLAATLLQSMKSSNNEQLHALQNSAQQKLVLSNITKQIQLKPQQVVSRKPVARSA